MKYPKKAEGCIGRNVVKIAIKMKTVVILFIIYFSINVIYHSNQKTLLNLHFGTNSLGIICSIIHATLETVLFVLLSGDFGLCFRLILPQYIS